MVQFAESIRNMLHAGSQWILPGLSLLFIIWILSKHHTWFPWTVRHAAATDLLLILGLSVFILIPLTQRGAPGGHDFYFHVSRVAELRWLFQDGYYYGRWTPDFNLGFGYPLFNFYPSLVYYPAQIFQAFGIVESLKPVIVSGVWLSGFFMYLLGKEFWGRYGGVLSAVAYMYVPYRMVALYVRGAIPEFYAMTFMPIVFWSFYKIVQTRQFRYVALGAVSYGLIIPTHNVSALFFTISLAAYSLFLLGDEWRYNPGDGWRNIVVKGWYLVMTTFLGIGLVAIYWLPAIYEKQFVKIRGLQTGYHDVAKHFVYFSQFFSRFWGYGGSREGPNDGMSFQLGLAHVLLVVLSVIVVTALRRAHPRKHNHVMFYSLLLFCLMFAMMSPSWPVWRTVPLIGFISFPWRLLSLTSFSLSFLCGGIFLMDFGTLRFFHRQRYAVWLPYINRGIQLGLIGGLLYFNAGYCRVETPRPLADRLFSRERLRISKGAALNPEYIPIWDETGSQDIQGGEIQVTDGDATFEVLRRDMLSQTVLVIAKSPTVLHIGHMYFPGWRAYVNGRSLAVHPEKSTGLISLNLLAGKHEIEIRFEDTRVRMLAKYLTFASVTLLLLAAVLHHSQGIRAQV